MDKLISSTQLLFCGNWSSNNAPTWHHFACSLKVSCVCFYLLEVLQCSPLFFRTDTLFSPCFQPTANSPSLRKASRNNPLPHSSSCMENDITSVRHCWTSFRKKQLYTTISLINFTKGFLIKVRYMLISWNSSESSYLDKNCLLMFQRKSHFE